MTVDTRSLDAEILHLRIRLAGREWERAMLLGQRDVAEGFRAVLEASIVERQDAELARAEQGNACYFDLAGELGGDAMAAREGLPNA